MRWDWVALGYVTYLAAVSLTRREFGRARAPVLAAAIVAWVSQATIVMLGGSGASLTPVLAVALPALVLLAGYWLSGLFFVRPDNRLERVLLDVDHALLLRSGVLGRYRQAPRGVVEYFELSYLLVYVAVPAGAAILALAGHSDRIGYFWTVVLLAEFACYGMLPWLQTRPPRALEPEPARLVRTRRLNLGVVNRASIGANTVPSGHAAGAMATALAVGSVMPLAGALLMILAISIAIASVLGRYHYLVDSVLGVLVAVGAWAIV